MCELHLHHETEEERIRLAQPSGETCKCGEHMTVGEAEGAGCCVQCYFHQEIEQ